MSIVKGWKGSVAVVFINSFVCRNQYIFQFSPVEFLTHKTTMKSTFTPPPMAIDTFLMKKLMTINVLNINLSSVEAKIYKSYCDGNSRQGVMLPMYHIHIS